MSAGQQDRYALAGMILKYLGPELAEEGYDLVDVRVFQGGGRQQVRLYVDLPGEDLIDLDGCAEASRSASMLLEATDFFSGPWILEVSSPGICPPLRREEHFIAAVGSEVRLRWQPAVALAQRPQNLRGRLIDVVDGKLTITPVAEQAEPIIVPISEVLEANLERELDVQAAIRRERHRRKQIKQGDRGARRRRTAEASRRADRSFAAEPGAAENNDDDSIGLGAEDEKD